MFLLYQLSLICVYSVLTVFASGSVLNTADPSIPPIKIADPRLAFSRENVESVLKGLSEVPTCIQRDPIFYEGLITAALGKMGDEVVVIGAKNGQSSPQYPVKRNHQHGCVEVSVQQNSHVFYVTFFYSVENPNISLYIHCCCYDGIEYGGVIGSELDEETLAFREVFTKLKQDSMYESIVKEIRNKYINEGYQFENAMRLASIGLQHENFQVETITDPERTGIKITGAKYIWYIEFDGEGKIVYSFTNKA